MDLNNMETVFTAQAAVYDRKATEASFLSKDDAFIDISLNCVTTKESQHNCVELLASQRF